MKCKRKWSVLSLIVSLIIHQLSAQVSVDQTASASFENLSIKEILYALEDLYQVEIYFQDDDQLERKFTLGFNDKKLTEVLDQLLQETTYGVLPYRDYAMVLLPKIIVQESFSSDYYEALSGNLNKQEDAQRKIVVGDISLLSASGKAWVKGFITDAQTEEPIIGATVRSNNTGLGTITNPDGSYELQLSAGEHQLQVTFVGYTDFFENVEIRSDGILDIQLDKGAIELSEVTVSAQAANASVGSVQIGVESIDLKTIEKLPTFLGEVDVVRSFLLQPGVSSIGEGASGFNVRGGDVDQNLILQDAGFLFNSSHALGFFSTFNSELIRTVELYKGNIPAQFGGRLASVMDVQMRDGDFTRFRIKGGIGPVSSRVSLEGPIIKDKVSFIVGGRSSYTDWIISRVESIEVQRSSSFFYDANARLTFKPNERHSFIVSGYSSTDDFTYNQEFGFDYTTWLGEFTYQAILGDNIFSKLSVAASNFESTQFDFEGLDASQLDNSIKYTKIRENLRYVPEESLEINAGASAILYAVNPGESSPFGDFSTIVPKKLEEDKGVEAAVFANAEYSISDALLISAGIRFTVYQYRGPNTVFSYENPERPEFSEIIGENLETGTLASYNSLEPRISMRFQLSDQTSIKAGYSRTSQFISQIFNSDSPTPTSQWQLSTEYIKPLRSHNYSVGVFRNFQDNNWETSLEVYTRLIDQLFDYKDFADLAVNDHLETELLNGEGRTYGLELSVKKKEGILNGWLSYTYSRSERKISGINRGEWYPSSFDKPHDISFVFNYNPNRRNTLTLNFNYSTGRPTTPPIGNYATSNGLIIPVYANRNALRIPDYMRMDLAYTIGRGYKRDRKFRTSWTFSLYNVLGRKNAFSVFFTEGPFQSAEANKLAVLGTVFPSLTLNFELL